MKHKESFSSSPAESSEQQEKKSKAEGFLSKVKGVKAYLAEKLGLKGKELDKATDDALVDAAKEAISEADADGQRTEDEEKQIEEAVSTVLVQGAMEEVGLADAPGENPIISLDPSGQSAEVVDSIVSLHEDDVTLPDGQGVAEVAVGVIEQAKWDRLVQVGHQEGSNPGGWFEDPETGDRYYVKFYRNKDQGRVEFLSNAIYTKLGIKTVRSEIAHINGEEAIASPAVKGITQEGMGWGERRDTLASSSDVLDGFVADCFLNNWDVVGLDFDNIVRAEDGFYRIDNGGSMIFRAQGGPKAFPPDSIKELKDLRDEKYKTGQVFHGISDEEIKRQARHLVENLSSEDIIALVDESGLEGETRDAVLQGLLGRREFLKELCGYEEEQEDFLTESGGGDGKPESDGSSPESAEAANIKRIGNILRSVLNKERETSYEEAPSPRGEIICDHGNLDDQRIEVIDDREDGVIRLRLKIRRGKSPLMSPVEMARYDHDAPYSVFMPQTMDGLKINRDDEITYRGEGAYGPESLKLCSAFSFERNGVTVRIADPSRPGDTIYSCSYNNSGLVRTSIGLVEISAPRDMDPDSIAGIVSDIFAKDFGLPDALDEVSPDSAAPYKRARLAWSRRAEAGSLSQEAEEAAEGMQLEEVFPGYSTYVQKGRHKELLAISGEGARAYHRLSMRLDDEGNPKDVGRKVARTLARGILCSTERFSRRLCFKGMSTEADMDSGGADSVFTRLGYEGDLKREYDKSGVVIVFKPEVFDRTDFYAQGGDTYGTTDADYFDGRLTPEDMFQKLKDQMLCGTNELMFRTGLAGSSIEYVLVEDESVRTAILDYMHDMGITEMYGKPVEELIRIRHEDHPVPVMVDHGATGAPIPPDPFGGGGFWPDQPEQTGESGSDMLELDDWVWPSEPEPEPEPIDYAKETLEKMREIARGTATYDNVGEILDFMYYNPREFDELIDDIFAKVGPDKIKSDFEDYILNMDTNDLKGIVDTLANKTSFEYNDDEMAVKFLIEKVGINFEELYAKKINGEQE